MPQTTFDVRKFNLSKMTQCGRVLRKMVQDSDSRERAAQNIAQYFYNSFTDGEGRKAFILSRFYETLPYSELTPKLREFARNAAKLPSIDENAKCLTLLGSAGDQPDWNSREKSSGHKAIPLLSEEMLERLPMVSNLVKQLGVDPASILRIRPELLLDMAQRTYNVFYVPEALGSPYIPAQEHFVVPYKVKSVVGFGGMLPSGNLFSVILFSRIPICPEIADSLRPLALNIKAGMILHLGKRPFAESKPITSGRQLEDSVLLSSKVSALEQLLEVNEQCVVDQYSKLQSAHEELQAAQRILIQTSKMSALGEMAAGMAHEINNPLATLRMLSGQVGDLLQEKTVDHDVVAKMATEMDRTIERIAKIILGMRRFSREGSDDPFEETSVQELIASTFDLCAKRFERSGIRLSLRDDLGSTKIQCRQVQISQVLLNLLSNAFDAIEKNSEKWIEVWVRAADKGHIELVVTDSGNGIPEATQSRLFEPFFTTKGVGRGTGLGLSISKGIVEQHNGTIAIDNTCQNTRFVVTLPRIQSNTSNGGNHA